MASYVVMTPPPGGRATLPEFVRDRFALLAFIAPPVWLLWHRLWIEAAFALALMIAIPALAVQFGGGYAAPWLSALVSLFVGVEGPALRLSALRRRGWTEAGVYEADDLTDAETRYAADLPAGPWSPRIA